MHIHYEGLALPISKQLADKLLDLLTQYEIAGDSVTINLSEPNYSTETGGFRPVEIRLEKRGDTWQFIYITDLTYVGSGPYAELAKELDFDFGAGVFPIEQAFETYQIWESNFLHHWVGMNIFKIKFSI